MAGRPGSTFAPSVPSLPLDAFLSTPGPVLDVRSPAEWRHARIPGAINFPLFSDSERAAVGTAYKNVGRAKAVNLGLELIGPRLPLLSTAAAEVAALLRDWQRSPSSPAPRLKIHCARGGMRSGAIAFLVSLLSLPCATLEGGYKAFRRAAVDRLDSPIPNLVVLSGRTGSGKSETLRTLKRRGRRVLDLEGAAGHRGSAFGGLTPIREVEGHGSSRLDLPRRTMDALGTIGGAVVPPPDQPTTEQFENTLFSDLRYYDAQPDPHGPIFTEHENHNIGRVNLSHGIHNLLISSPRIRLEPARQDRLERILREYGSCPTEPLMEATIKISKKLGGERTKEVLKRLELGNVNEAANLLLEHYDVLYDRAAEKRGDRPVAVVEGSGWDADKWADEVERIGETIISGRLGQGRGGGPVGKI